MSAPAQRLLTLTDIHGIAHLVTDEAMTTGHHSGRYLSLCAQRVLTASLTTPTAAPLPGLRPAPERPMSGGVCEYLVLRRVRDGHLALIDSRYYNQGIRLGAHLIGVLDRLRVDGRVAPVTKDGLERFILTSRGRSRLTALERLAPLTVRSRLD